MPVWSSAVAFNPNGRWGISGGFDGVVAAWKVASGEEIWRVEKLGTVTAIAVDPGGRYVLVAANRFVHLLDLATGKMIRSHGQSPTPAASLGVSPNGNWYIAGEDDGTVRVWKFGEAKATFVLTGHAGPVRSRGREGRWRDSSSRPARTAHYDSGTPPNGRRRKLPFSASIRFR